MRLLILLCAAALVPAPFYPREEELPRRASCEAPLTPLISSAAAPAAVEHAALASAEPIARVRSASLSPSAAELIARRQPLLLHGTAVDTWPARAWTWDTLAARLDGEEFVGVARLAGGLYAPVDVKAALEPRLRYPAGLEAVNMSARAFFAAVERARPLHQVGTSREAWRAAGDRLVHFSQVPPRMRPALEPQAWMYPPTDDSKTRLQYVWLSTPGVRTHTHFDSDPNLFVQLIGEKRFFLWAPNQTARMCPFPRLHPLWHKSRVDFEKPDLTIAPCEGYNKSHAFVADVGPGDVLYVPPYWWHTVETLGPSPSLSLSTLSRWPQLYIHLNAIYSHEFFFDSLQSYTSRLYGLRLFLTQLLRKAAGGEAGSENTFIATLVRQYTGFEDLFERDPDDEQKLCVLDERGTPTCRNCLGRTSFDVTIVWDEHLTQLPEDVRPTVLSEFIEEVTQFVVGTNKTLPFWEQCFKGQRFFLTKGDSKEHSELWTEASKEEG